MQFAKTALALLASALYVAAQNQTVTVQVGGTATLAGGVFQFIPSSITATNGSVVTFQFTGNPGNHSVTQSSFADPCNPLSGGFDSGWIFLNSTSVTAAQSPTWELTITDDSKRGALVPFRMSVQSITDAAFPTAIWFYCKQLKPSPHCKAGMVGSINAPASGNTYSSFKANAVAFTATPGQAQGGLVGVGASASAVPVLPSAATLAPGTLTGSAPAASATAPGASSAASGSASASASASPTSGAAGAASLGGSAQALALLVVFATGGFMLF
ncbi:unnamed protein product [Mycena citricolor]|uniref:Uncharacterized protein n=1 Tax=Mycena citricolor TaxID=2018698 RepID=A0AAD2HB67_9AGAR|nr:unnamed protein product [Mycena citricolor]